MTRKFSKLGNLSLLQKVNLSFKTPAEVHHVERFRHVGIDTRSGSGQKLLFICLIGASTNIFNDILISPLNISEFLLYFTNLKILQRALIFKIFKYLISTNVSLLQKLPLIMPMKC